MERIFEPDSGMGRELAKCFRLAAKELESLHRSVPNKNNMSEQELREYLKECVSVLRELESDVISIVPSNVLIEDNYNDYLLQEILLGAVYEIMWARYGVAWCLDIIYTGQYSGLNLEFAINGPYTLTVESFPEIARLLTGKKERVSLARLERSYGEYRLSHFTI